MDKSKTAEVNLTNGVYVRGIVVSNRAKTIRRKDGSGISVIIEVEIGTQPGVVTWTRFVDPATDKSVRLVGDTVAEYPRWKEFEPITIRATSIKSDERTGQLTIRAGEVLV